MGKLLALALLVAGGAPAPDGAPDGLLVMGTVERGGIVVHAERAVVADPRTGEVTYRRLPGGTLCYGQVTAAGDRVHYPGHRGRRSVLLSLPLSLSGAPRVLPEGRPESNQLSRRAPSPDGSRVAVALTKGGGQRLAVRDLGTGSRTMVPGGVLPDFYTPMAWSPSGEWLYFSGPKRRLFAWRPGSSAPVRLPVDTRGAVMSMVTTG
jgi:hypothetical protein